MDTSRKPYRIMKAFNVYSKKVGNSVKKYLESDGHHFRFIKIGPGYDECRFYWRCVKCNTS